MQIFNRRRYNVSEIIDKALEVKTQKGKFLTFLLGKEVYAIEIKFVIEIIEFSQ